MKTRNLLLVQSGADLGGAGGGRFRSGIRPPADPKGPPFDTFSEIHIWPTGSKIFLEAPSRQYILTLRGSARQKKRDFFVKIFQKVPKNGPNKVSKSAQTNFSKSAQELEKSIWST